MSDINDLGARAEAPGSRASTEPVPVSAASGFDPSRWMQLYCGLANARYALEYWDRECRVEAKRGDPIPSFIQDCVIRRGLEEIANLRDLESLVRPFACRDSDEHRHGEDAKRLSGEAMPARAEGIAHPDPGPTS